ncbi:Beta-ketoacyl synthase [Pedosphaera parvula Ellin514]|uniref:Beta-ketoacyl synthase n=2 Tax=Pedosphaera TaxID=1032526 RepID=B9XKX0_PEDPL|nr:Beta-ketoacyl synthase [Pedosphaera parvula Ellin514]
MSYDIPPRRVVITGMGFMTPSGHSVETFWNNIRRGISAAGFVSRFDTNKMPNKLAAEVKDFDPTLYMDSKTARRCDVVTQYSIAAAYMAVQDSGVDFTSIDPDRTGVVEGTTVSGMESMFEGQQTYLKKGYRGLSPFTVINAYCGEGSSRIALELGIKGHAITYCSGCASGNDAVGYGLKMIQDDEVDVMVAGATDDTMAEPMYGGFCLLDVMTRHSDNPQRAMRSFDRSRDGFVLGEGAVFLVLEELSHALVRGAKIYAEVIGHGRSCEAYHSTNTHPEGIGFRRAMEKALRKARIHPSEVSYINAHGTATQSNDPIETKAIKHVFHEHSRRLAISSTKAITGHLMGAAGAIETAVCALALKHQELPPTINLNDPADGCDLDYVANHSRPYPVKVAVNLNAGFGGKNACLVLKAYSP